MKDKESGKDRDKDLKRLPDSELEIMIIIWKAGEPVTSAYVIQKLEGEKDWATTTVLNFLARLVERQFLAVKKQGKINIYTPLVTEREYLEKESKSFLERLHGRSLKSFVAALYDGQSIDKEDMKELKSYIEELTREAEDAKGTEGK